MLTLVAPTVARHGAWLASHREWGSGMHEDGYGLAADDEVESVAGFARFVQRVTTLANARMWWVLDGHEVVGGVALRTAKAANVLQRGHVGYGVRPSVRGRGIGSWALGEVLRRAPVVGVERVLLVCMEDNIPSIKTIEHHGGVLEDIVNEGGVPVRRYWIDVMQSGMGSDR